MVLSDDLLAKYRFFTCPAELQVTEHRPNMSIEVWLDIQHPSNISKNYEPLLKQVTFPETSYETRRLIKSANTYKIEFVRQIDKERIPWAWVGSVKAGGENIDSKVWK